MWPDSNDGSMVAQAERRRRPSSRADRAVDIVVGSRVQVLPGRQFPTFAAGDVGSAVHVDREARTCDVLFDAHSCGPVPVALRHLGLERSGRGAPTDGGQGPQQPLLPRGQSDETPPLDHARRSASGTLPSRSVPDSNDWEDAEAVEEGASFLADRLSLLQRALSTLETRVVACETSVERFGQKSQANDASQHGPGSGRSVASRVAALEGAHQAEIDELRRSLEDTLALRREQELQQRRQQAATQELERQLRDVEGHAADLRQAARELDSNVDRLSGMLDGQVERMQRLEGSLSSTGASLEAHECRARCVEAAVDAAGAGMARLCGLLEGHEQRAAEISQAVSAAGQEAEAQVRSVRVLQGGGALTGEVQGLDKGRGARDNEHIWQALRELQELVVHESEHRAAGLREVLGVLSQGVEQLRGEQTRHAADVDGRSRTEGRRAKQRLAESQARHAEHERRAEALELRVDALTQAIAAERCARVEAVAWLEEHGREPHLRSPHGSPRPLAEATAPGVSSAPSAPGVCPARGDGPLASQVTTRMVASQSLQRLELLEARFDAGRPGSGRTSPLRIEEAQAQAKAQAALEARQTVTGGTLGKLRGQLEGLRCELAGKACTEGTDNIAIVSAQGNGGDLLSNGTAVGLRKVQDSLGSFRIPDESADAAVGDHLHGSLHASKRMLAVQRSTSPQSHWPQMPPLLLEAQTPSTPTETILRGALPLQAAVAPHPAPVCAAAPSLMAGVGSWARAGCLQEPGSGSPSPPGRAAALGAPGAPCARRADAGEQRPGAAPARGPSPRAVTTGPAKIARPPGPPGEAAAAAGEGRAPSPGAEGAERPSPAHGPQARRP